MSSLWLPDTLYRSLPVVYGVAGLALLLLFRGNLIAALSALLLIGAGVLVSLWRWRHRATAATSVSAREAFYQRKRRNPDMVLTQF